jgi:hypothetical protein
MYFACSYAHGQYIVVFMPTMYFHFYCTLTEKIQKYITCNYYFQYIFTVHYIDFVPIGHFLTFC